MDYLKTETLRLRALEPEDLDTLYRWENDTTLWSCGSTLVPYSRHSLREYLNHVSDDIYQSRQLRLMIESVPEGLTLGTIDLYDFDPFHNRAAVGILVDRQYQGRHIAQQSLNLLICYAFDFLRLSQLYAYVPELNEISYKLFSTNRFVECGRLEKWLKYGKDYQAVYIMQCINTD